MRKRTCAVVALIPVAALCAGVGVFQPETEGTPGRRGEQPADPGAFLDRMFERDADGDGKLSRAELGDGPGARIFDAADANTDGFLDRPELEKFVAERRAARPGAGRVPGAEGEAATASAEGFHESMETAGRALRRLSRSRFDAESRATDLEQIEAVQRALLNAKAAHLTAEVAEQAREEFAGDDAKLRSELRRHLAHGLQAAVETELAVLESNPEAAAAGLVRLQELRDEGHDRFEPTEEDDG